MTFTPGWREAVARASGANFGFQYNYPGPRHISEDPHACLEYLMASGAGSVPPPFDGLSPSLGAFQEWAQARVQANAAGNYFFATYIQEVKKGYEAQEANKKLEQEKKKLIEEKGKLIEEKEKLAEGKAASQKEAQNAYATIQKLRAEVEQLKADRTSCDHALEEAARKASEKEEETQARMARIRAYMDGAKKKNSSFMELSIMKEVHRSLKDLPAVSDKTKAGLLEEIARLEQEFERVVVPELLPGDLPGTPQTKVGEKTESDVPTPSGEKRTEEQL